MPYVELTPSNDLFYRAARKGRKKLTIITNVEGASINFITTTRTVKGKSIWVPSGTIVKYTVQAPYYGSVSDIVEVNDDMSVLVSLVDPEMLRVCGTFSCGTSSL